MVTGNVRKKTTASACLSLTPNESPSASSSTSQSPNLPAISTNPALKRKHFIESYRFKRKLKIMTTKYMYNKLFNDPPESFLLKHRRKLASCSQPEVFNLLNDHLEDFRRKKNGFRYSNGTKTLASRILYGHDRYRQVSSMLPLPSMRTIKRSTSNTIAKTGWSESLEKVLRNSFSTLQPPDRFCLLGFDETEIKSRVSYNEKFDMVEGFVYLDTLVESQKKRKKY